MKKKPDSLIGKSCSLSCLHKYKVENGLAKALFTKERVSGNKNVNWKGDDISYGSVHDYISYHKGKPRRCEKCGDTTKRYYDWANIDGKYTRDFDKWIRLCRPCHYKLDLRRHKKLIDWQKKPIRNKTKKTKSGFKNVRITAEGRYKAYISINKKQVHLGNFDTGEQAFEAYKKKALEVYGYY